MRTRQPAIAGMLLLLALLLAATSPATAQDDESSYPTWQWPLAGGRDVAEPYRAPAHEYAAGHRGADLRASVGTTVIAPASGTVAFRGTVVDRPVLTIEHGGGFVTTFEPLSSVLSPGDAVAAGDAIGVIATGGHSLPGTLHLGVRLSGEYLNPLLMFGELPRAVLLPCCDAL